MDGVENPCSSEQYGVGFPSLGITKRLIPARLPMLDEKECYSSHLSSGWHGFPSGCLSGYALGTSLGKPMPSLAQMRRVLHSRLKPGYWSMWFMLLSHWLRMREMVQCLDICNCTNQNVCGTQVSTPAWDSCLLVKSGDMNSQDDFWFRENQIWY